MSHSPDLGMGHRRITHIDMDACYVSVEQCDDPRCAGSIAVGGLGVRSW